MVVAVDSSTVIAFVQGDRGRDVDAFDAALDGNVVLPPVVLTELLSQPKLPARHRDMLLAFPLLEIRIDHWQRAAAARSIILAKKLRARLLDTLIAQCCIDHDIALITRDGDFRHFAKHCGLKLA
jgi:predicted nucleic acid-binding protein